MAMTKKERQAMDAAIDRAELLAALRWTAPVEADLPIPESCDITEGWDFNAYSGTVYRAWSGCVRNGTGDYRTSSSASQGGRRLFSTRARAIAALRHEVERQSAERLRMIDKLAAEAEP